MADTEFARAELVSADAALRPGRISWFAVHLTMKPGWHTYWRNPGDSGQATEIAWSLPEGYQAGTVYWPVPSVFVSGIATSYGYEGEVALLVPITVPSGAAPGEKAEIAAEVAWLACEKICVPESARVSLTLPVADKAPADFAAIHLFARARAALPQEIHAPVRGRVDGEYVALDLPELALRDAGASTVTFLPAIDTLIEHGAPQALEGKTLRLRRSQVSAKPPAQVEGVLVVEDKAAQKRRGYKLSVDLSIAN